MDAAETGRKMKLFVTDKGDESVGIFAQTWEVECPFDAGDFDDESVEFFRTEVKRLYSRFVDAPVVAEYDYEKDLPDFFAEIEQ